MTLLAFVLSVALQAPFTASTSSIFSGPEKPDFTITDIYAQIADGRPVRRMEDRIRIIDIGIGGREEIADALEILSFCEPKAVGLDIIFEQPSDDDSRLLAALQSTPNIVLPIGVTSDGDRFKIDDRPFFYEDLPGISYGVINIPTAGPKSSVREYAVSFPTSDGKLPSFVAAVAEKSDPDAVKALTGRGNDVETIAYHSKEYKIYTLDELADHAEEFIDKIVLIGSMSDASDMHPTPINSYVPGFIIHASALSTLLDREWYTTLPRYMDYLLAFVICFLIILATIGIKGGIRGLIVRIIQVVLAYSAVRIGYELFIDKHIVCNFSGTLLMIAFGLFAVDIWNGMSALISLLKKNIKKIKNKRETTRTCENCY
ncbi:MAG: CHASE2 domain-containing protein [Bacteroides sp.]|nr:CHASE2 domain-containing protein [Bacteroides sp.]